MYFFALPAQVIKETEASVVNNPKFPEAYMQAAGKKIAMIARDAGRLHRTKKTTLYYHDYPCQDLLHPELLRNLNRQHYSKAQEMEEVRYHFLLLVGPGGNGADALYAGVELTKQLGTRGGMHFNDTPVNEPIIHAILVGGKDKVHKPALDAFVEAGGEVVDKPLPRYNVLIDGIVGLGSTRGLDAATAQILDEVETDMVLAIDVPSGIHVDTGVTPAPIELRGRHIPAHVQADITITFGCLRLAHCINNNCGIVALCDLRPPSDLGILPSLHELFVHEAQEQPLVTLWNAVGLPGRAIPFRNIELPPQMRSKSFEPPADAHKYTGFCGIVGGSNDYPGAAILSSGAAVQSTSYMVKLWTTEETKSLVIHHYPEIVCAVPDSTTEVDERVRAWVLGPGMDAALQDFALKVLRTQAPVVIDASGLGYLSQDPAQRDLLRSRGEQGLITLLTPHDGEFAALAAACGLDPDLGRLDGARALATELGCTVLLKGRRTIITDGDVTHCVDLGHSWLATPGSGDVLAGMIGATIAREHPLEPLFLPQLLVLVLNIYSSAALTAASGLSDLGQAPIRATNIVENIKDAIHASCDAGQKHIVLDNWLENIYWNREYTY